MFWTEYYTSMIILLPAVLLSLYASGKVKRNFAKYSTVRSQCGKTGAEVGLEILRSQGIFDVNIERIGGNLTDHYDPRTKTLRLSNGVYDKTSISAISVAAHECGHAVQHHIGYFPLKFRTALVPVVNFASSMSMPIIIIGIMFGGAKGTEFINFGILLFSASVLFQLVTLPVEFNASSRAIKIMVNNGIINESERKGATEVLSAAALTYVAAALSSILSLARLIFLSRDSQE